MPKSYRLGTLDSHKEHGYWNKLSNQRSFLDEIAKKLNIRTQDDWYKVTSTTLQQCGAVALLEKYHKSPSALLSAVYPEYPKCKKKG